MKLKKRHIVFLGLVVCFWGGVLALVLASKYRKQQELEREMERLANLTPFEELERSAWARVPPLTAQELSTFASAERDVQLSTCAVLVARHDARVVMKARESGTFESVRASADKCQICMQEASREQAYPTIDEAAEHCARKNWVWRQQKYTAPKDIQIAEIVRGAGHETSRKKKPGKITLSHWANASYASRVDACRSFVTNTSPVARASQGRKGQEHVMTRMVMQCMTCINEVAVDPALGDQEVSEIAAMCALLTWNKKK